MIKRDTCYFCTSPFQLFAILSLALERDEEADLYLDPQFRNCETYAERIRQKNIFNKVHIIKRDEIESRYLSSDSKLVKHLKMAGSYLDVSKISKIIDPEQVKYDNIFISSKAYLPRLYILDYYKKNYNFNIYFFDDGLGSYFGSSAYKISGADALLRKMLFGKKAVSFDYDRFLFSPELYYKVNGEQGFKINKIDCFWNKPEYADLADDVFAVSVETHIREKAVLLEEPFETIFDSENAAEMESIYDEIIRSFGRDDSIIKKHPRSKKAGNPEYNYFANYSLPFEVLCMKNSIDDKILITYGSTAVVTPKLLLGQEPRLLLLYKLAECEDISFELLDGIFNKVKESYSDPGRVMIPKDRDELRQCLTALK